LLSDRCYRFIQTHAAQLDETIVHDRDFHLTYHGFQSLCKSYLLKVDGRIVERPQHLWMRVACGIHMSEVDVEDQKSDLNDAIETYNLMSNRYFIHASPTLFHAGSPFGQLASCFLTGIVSDSIDGIYSSLKDCANLSKYAGGIGFNVHDIRATGSYIRGTGGTSNGLVPMLKVFNDTARYVDQGGGKRKGAFAAYLEPWHADIWSFLDLKKNTGTDETRARDLFFGLWIPDLFMRRVDADKDWCLFCPNEAPGLANVCGDEFDRLYEQYETTKFVRERFPARKLWKAIIDTQSEVGLPYMLYKDPCNLKSNQRHLGVIRSSNLCSEIVEYSSPEEIAVCNLASIGLPMFVKSGTFDHDELFRVTQIIVRNLNKIIDLNFYAVAKTRFSNLRHRPMGIGVQGQDDVFKMMRFPWESSEAAQLNREMYETIYFAACTASMELAKKHGPYETYQGSPMSQGLFQFDLWKRPLNFSGRWDWDDLRAKVKQYGMRNSLLVALMPTASTSEFLGFRECFEPATSNLYVRRTLAGEFTYVSKYLVQDLAALGLWNTEMKTKIIAANGSVQNIPEIPENVRVLHKTVWEIKTKTLLDMAADRGVFVCQSQSMNVFMENITYAKLTSMHFYAWKLGLKTGMYYLRSKPAHDTLKVTQPVDKRKRTQSDMEANAEPVDKRKRESSDMESNAEPPVDKRKQESSDMEANKRPEGAFCSRENGCVSCGS